MWFDPFLPKGTLGKCEIQCLKRHYLKGKYEEKEKALTAEYDQLTFKLLVMLFKPQRMFKKQSGDFLEGIFERRKIDVPTDCLYILLDHSFCLMKLSQELWEFLAHLDRTDLR